MRTLIIAEAGQNHNGNYKLAEQLVEEAFAAGADIVKFQTSNAKLMTSRYAQKADYQKKATGSNESQLEMLDRIHLKYPDFINLKKKCDDVGIQFLSTPFELESIKFLEQFDMPFWKIPSGEITNLPYLLAVARTEKPVVMSTGMCEMKEIEEAIKALKENGTKDICLLHCNTEYPTPISDVNLCAMKTMRDYFGVEVGYSDHTLGIEVPIAAVAMGAVIIEKHMTLERNMCGPDHMASLEPQEFACMVQSIRKVEQALGGYDKVVSPSEAKNRDIARKSIVAQKKIYKGELLTEENITTKRPGNGINPMRWYEVIGTHAIRDFSEDELIEL